MKSYIMIVKPQELQEEDDNSNLLIFIEYEFTWTYTQGNLIYNLQYKKIMIINLKIISQYKFCWWFFGEQGINHIHKNYKNYKRVM